MPVWLESITVARAHRWNRMLEAGRYRSAQEIADAEKIGRSFVSRLLRLTLLAPDIQEAILYGRQPKGMQLEELTRAMPAEWNEQRLLARPESGDANFSKRITAVRLTEQTWL
jgi:hypothetical protein